MKFLSVCSGIEAASVATAELGWQAVAFAEIEPFPCALLAYRYPEVPNLGDLTRWREWPDELLCQVDILMGGTPCQAFSFAGLRLSLDDDRGNLTLTYCHLHDHITNLRRAAGLPAPLCLWENVPGVLSTKDNAFGCFLGLLAGEDVPLVPPGRRWEDAGAVLGPQRTVAWRILDAQYWALAQRRRRVFVVASADPAIDPLAVLFESEGVRRDSPPSREPGKGFAHDVAPSLTGSGRGVGRPGETRGQDPVIAECASETGAGFWTDDGLARLRVTTAPTQPQTIVAFGGNNLSGAIDVATACLAKKSVKLDFETETFLCEPVAGTLNANGKAAGSATQQDAECGMLIPCAFKASYFTRGKDGEPSPVAPPLSADADKGDQDTLVLAFAENSRSELRLEGGDDQRCGALSTGGGKPGQGTPMVAYRTSGNCGAWATGDRIDALTTGTDPNSHVVAFAIQERAVCENPNAGPDGVGVRSDDCAYTLEARQTAQAVAFQPRIARNGRGDTGDIVNALQAQSGQSGKGDAAPCVATQESLQWRVRRLSCEECEILMGFPIGYSLLPQAARGKTRLRLPADHLETVAYLVELGFFADEAADLAHSPDGCRYKALGNSWAVPVVRWICERIHSAVQPLNDRKP